MKIKNVKRVWRAKESTCLLPRNTKEYARSNQANKHFEVQSELKIKPFTKLFPKKFSNRISSNFCSLLS